MNLKNAVKCVAFVIIAAGIFIGTFRVLWLKDDVYSREVFDEFYALPKNSLDAVLIGSSGIREYYIAVQAFKKCGLASYALGTGNQPLLAAEYVIREAEKTQSPKVYVIDIRQSSMYGTDAGAIRRTSDVFKFSINRIHLIDTLIENLLAFKPDTEVNKFDYYFSYPLYHSRWETIDAEDFRTSEKEWMGYNLYRAIQNFEDYDFSLLKTSPKPLPEYNEKTINHLLDYCDTLDAKVLFVSMPACYDAEINARLNRAKELIEERGYTVKDLNYDVEEIGLDYSSDFKNNFHVNMWGAIKVTDYLAEWLQKEYSLNDNRGNSKYKVYEDKFDSYKKARLIATDDIDKYLEMLKYYDNCTIIFSAKGDLCLNLKEHTVRKIQSLGLKYPLVEAQQQEYVGIIENENVIYENSGSGLNPEKDPDNSFYGLQKYNNGGILRQLIEFSANSRGISIAVYDNNSGECLDTVTFDLNAGETIRE